MQRSKCYYFRISCLIGILLFYCTALIDYETVLGLLIRIGWRITCIPLWVISENQLFYWVGFRWGIHLLEVVSAFIVCCVVDYAINKYRQRTKPSDK